MPSAEPRHASGRSPRSSFAGRSTSLGKSQPTSSSQKSPKGRAHRSLPLPGGPSSSSPAPVKQPPCLRQCCVPSTSRCHRPRDDPRQVDRWPDEATRSAATANGGGMFSDSSLVRKSAGPKLASTSKRRQSEPSPSRPPPPPPVQQPRAQPRQQPPAHQQPPRHVPAPRQAPPPPPTAQTIQPSPQSRSGTIFGFIIAAFVLLCSGAVSVYYVWYSHGEFVRQRTTELNRFDAQGPRTETPVEVEPPFLAGLPARPNGEQPPASQLQPETTTATSTKREMYFGTPLGRRRALKLRPEDDTASELASRRHRCMTRFCQERTDAVLSALNWTIDPCTDFEAFTCSRWQAPAPAEALLAEQLERELYLSLSSKLKPEVWRVEGLLEECLRSPLPQASRLQLRSLLRDMGLYGWPFRADAHSRGDVWKAAALLFRHLSLTPLLGLAVAPHPRNATQPLVTLDEPDMLTDPAHALDTAFKQYTPGRYVELAERVSDFSSRLSQIVTGRRAARLSTLRSHASFAPFLALALGDLVKLQERTPLLLRCERFVRALKALLHATRNRDLLNYLGYRALVYVSPLLAEDSRPLASARMLQITGRRRYAWPRWRRCVRLAERAAPELMAYALARAIQLDRIAGLRFARDLAAAVNESLGAFEWLAEADRRNARTLLGALDVQVFYPAWMSNTTLREAYDSMFPEVTRGNVLQTYRDFMRKSTERRLAAQLGAGDATDGSSGKSGGNREGAAALIDAPLSAPWPWSALDVRAGLDADALRVFVPPALVNGSTHGGDAWLAAQLPAQGPRLAQALLEALHERAHPAARYHWSLNTSVQAAQLERCLQPAGGLVARLSLEPSRALFNRYVSTVRAQGIQDAAFLSPGNVTSERLFYVLFAMGGCGDTTGDAKKGRVNAALRETPQFAAAWDCRVRSPMAPRQQCLPPRETTSSP
ncbi:hypothetical protein MRX96_002743 [Rhipicephalus microplus]